MRAIILRQHGELDQAQFVDNHPRPTPGPDEALIRVHAASVNRHDLFTVHGMPGIQLPLPVVLGSDFAGEVAELGSEVSGWSLGQRVAIDPIFPGKGLMGELVDGGFADYCVVKASQLIALPDDISFGVAAALPVAYATAHRMLFTNGRIRPRDKVLVLGAAGGVGTCCVLLAKQHGCEVVACASSDAKLDRLHQLGADHLINYTQVDFMKWVHGHYGKPARRSEHGGVDVVVNFTGGDTWVKSLRSLKAGGKLLTCGATAGFDPKEDLRYVFMHELQIIGSNAWRRSDIESLLQMCQSGALRPTIDKVLPLERAQEALRLMEDRESFGKILVEITPGSAQ
jgi:NADPH:quinone reductase-like Zn-dependent oxidoreductase